MELHGAEVEVACEKRLVPFQVWWEGRGVTFRSLDASWSHSVEVVSQRLRLSTIALTDPRGYVVPLWRLGFEYVLIMNEISDLPLILPQHVAFRSTFTVNGMVHHVRNKGELAEACTSVRHAIF